MTRPTKPHIDQVRTALLATLADLRDRTNPMDLDRAKAVATVASVLVDTARVENEYLKLTGQDHSQFLHLAAEPDPAQLGTTVLPGDRNGITSITQHRLQG